MTDWIPVNPYAVPEGVSFQEAVNIEQQNKYEYMAFLEGVEAGQRKLLEYLIEWAKTNPLIMHGWVECHAVHQDRLQAMLKEASQ